MSIILYVNAQEFSFKMFFEDFIGNKDTITIGYDPSATNGIDEVFGEINIIEKPFKPNFDVRISEEWKQRHDLGYDEKKGTFATYHTKKQIIKKSKYIPDETMNMVIGIDVCTKNYPVKAYWDSTLFEDVFLIESRFTSFDPWAWWDVGSTFVYNLAEESEGVVTPEPYYAGSPRPRYW